MATLPAGTNDAFAALSITPGVAVSTAKAPQSKSTRGGSNDETSGDFEEDEFEKRRALWQETWKEILPASHLLASPPSPSSAAAAACPLADLLKPPLLTAFVSSLSEALLKSPSWFVRQQAGLALLSVSTAIVSQPMFILTTAASSLIRDVVALARSSAEATAPPAAQRLTEGEDEEELEDEELDEDDDEEEEEDEEEETVFLIWSELVRLLASSLSQTGSWTGKVCSVLPLRIVYFRFSQMPILIHCTISNKKRIFTFD